VTGPGVPSEKDEVERKKEKKSDERQVEVTVETLEDGKRVELEIEFSLVRLEEMCVGPGGSSTIEWEWDILSIDEDGVLGTLASVGEEGDGEMLFVARGGDDCGRSRREVGGASECLQPHFFRDSLLGISGGALGPTPSLPRLVFSDTGEAGVHKSSVLVHGDTDTTSQSKKSVQATGLPLHQRQPSLSREVHTLITGRIHSASTQLTVADVHAGVELHRKSLVAVTKAEETEASS